MKKLVLFFCIVLMGCSVNPSKVTDKYAKEFISKTSYVKDDRTGMCFAIVATRMTFHSDQNGISFTWVPCENVKDFLVK